VIDKPQIDLLTLPLKSEYKVLVFKGAANGGDLTPFFNLDIITGRRMVIKSIRLIPYTSGDYVDFYTNDGAGTILTETIQANLRINRLFDDFVFGASIYFRINQNPLPMFVNNVLAYPLDLWIDNVFYLFPEKVQEIVVRVNGRVEQDISGVAGGLVSPNILVQVECYLI